MKTLLWFHRDLRLADNPAVDHAASMGDVIAVYIHSPDEESPWGLGGASRWCLHHGLKSLAREIRRLGGRLIIRHGPVQEALAQLFAETGAAELAWNRCQEPGWRLREEMITRRFSEQGITCRSFNGNLLFEPSHILSRQGDSYHVFTPFWKTCQQFGLPSRTLPAPPSLADGAGTIASLTVEELGLLPRSGWDAAFHDHWRPGELAARRRLEEFCHARLADYAQWRDFPARGAGARLSPHLHFGEISPRQIVAAVQQAMHEQTAPGMVAAGEAFLRELAWREFSHYILYHHPHTVERSFDARYDGFPWHEDARLLQAWQRGRTGIPLVDAGMRELWATGFMHNRVRMIVASFLTKNCLISWQEGARWFQDTLLDADLPSNTFNWQWVAGCGADAAPYFRIFNPVTQGVKFDAQGAYVRRWVPELARLPDKFIHAPRKAPAAILEEAGIRPGSDYPEPVVDLAQSRDEAVAYFAAHVRKRQ